MEYTGSEKFSAVLQFGTSSQDYQWEGFYTAAPENKRPIFRSNNCKIVDDLKFVGKESQIVKSYIMDSSNTKLPFISFIKKDELVNLKSSFNVLFTTSINSYSGKDQVEIIIKEISSN